MAILMLVAFGLFWYGIGFLGLMLTFKANFDWTYITRFQMFWMLVLWAWFGPITFCFAIMAFAVTYKQGNNNFWNERVYTKKRYYD